MFERRSLKFPITLGVTLLRLLVLMLVGVLGALQAAEHAPIYGTLLSVGTVVLAIILAGIVAYLVMSIQSINLNRRQLNFLDSVTHELKSPIASLKLCLSNVNVTIASHTCVQLTIKSLAQFDLRPSFLSLRKNSGLAPEPRSFTDQSKLNPINWKGSSRRPLASWLHLVVRKSITLAVFDAH